MSSPAGYQVGTAWIQVLPSFDGFQKLAAAKMAGLGSIRVDVEPQVSPKKAAAAMKAMDERLAKTPVVRRLDLDDRVYRAKLAQVTAKRDEMVLRIDADISALDARIANWERKRGKTTIDVDAEIAKAQAKIAYLKSRRDSVTIDFDVDVDKAEQALHSLDRDLSRLRNNQTDINIEASDASRAIALVGALTVALSVLGQVAPAAAAAVAAVPNAIFAAAQGFSAVKAGVSGVSDATKALQAIEDQAATTSATAAKQRVDTANRVASAQSSLQRALEQADRSAIHSAHQVRNAREGLADAQVSATRHVEDAERTLARAQASAQDAQDALTRARKDATEQLEDLRLAVSGAALDEEAAVLAVERARRKLAAARAANLSGLDMVEIELGARQAEQALAEVRERYGDLREEAGEANRSGVDGSRQVVAAQEQAADAAQRITDAERDLAQARVDGARQVAKAQEQVAQAQQQASYAAADASRAVADAQRAIEAAATSAGDASTAAMDKLLTTMGKLSPAGQEFVRFLQNSVKPALHDISRAASSTLLPRLEVAFSQLLTMAPAVAQAMSDTGKVIGDLAIKGAELATSPAWRGDFGTIVARNNRIIASMGDAGLSALDAMRSLTVASGPLAESLASLAEAKLDEFNEWIQNLRDSGELQVWFAEMSVRVKEFFTAVGQVAGGIWDLLQAVAPLGRVILDIVGPFVQWVGAMAEANPVLSAVVAIAILGTSSFVSFFRTVGGLKQAFSTSIGVYQDVRNSLFGAKEAADAASTSASKTATATQTVGLAADRSRGLVGRFTDSLRDGYTTGSTVTKSWATTTTSAVGQVGSAITGRLVPDIQLGVTEFGKFPAATQTAGGALQRFGTAAQTALGNIAGAVGGTVTAVGRGLGGVVTGLVGALGGPFGLAIGAATIGLGFLVNSQAEAAQAAAEHKAQIQSLTDALVESGGAIDENVRKQVRLNLEQRGVADNANNMGLGLGRMIRAVAEGGDAAESFEKDLIDLASELTVGKGLAEDDALFLRKMAQQLVATGGSANDFSGDISALATEWQRQTGATDEATAAYAAQLTQYLDLAGGYHDAQGDFDTAQQGQKDIAEAQEGAAGATERHVRAIDKLQKKILGQIDKDLAYRQSLLSLEDAQNRVATATEEELPAALLAQEQAMVDVITSAGELGYANSKAADETGKLRDAQLEQAQAAIDLANAHVGPLPASLQTYLDKLWIVKTASGEYKSLLGEIPPYILTKADFDDADARKKYQDYVAFINKDISAAEYLAARGIPVTPENVRAVQQGARYKAQGGVDIAAYAMGGVRPMAATRAQIVPPRQPRLIGDRMQHDEGFVPINREPHSIAILMEIARRMGFQLLPMFRGGILGMQSGGVNEVGATAGVAGANTALTIDLNAVVAFSAAVRDLMTAALAPLANELTATTVPALSLLEQHAGVESVAAVTALRNDFALTAQSVTSSWREMTQVSSASVAAIGGYLSVLRSGMDVTRGAMSALADWAFAQWAKIQPAAADPIRWVLQFPLNAGLIAAWNRLNTDFAMGKPAAPVAIPFREGGRVPGVGNEDKVRALLTPGEIVFDRLAIQNLGGVAAVERLRQLARAGIIGQNQRLGGEPGDAAARLRLMRTVPLDGLGFAYGGVQPHVAMAGAEIEDKFGQLPGGIGGVGSRPNASDHPSGLALDFMTMRDVGLGNRIAGYLTNNAQRLAIKYLIWQQKFNEGTGWSAMADRGSPTANHMDHVHSSFLKLGQAGRAFSGIGAALDPATYFAATRDLIGRIPGLFPGNIAGEQAGVVATRAMDGALAYADQLTTMGGNIGDVESWRPLVLQALRMLDLPLEWADITLRRIAQESGGNPRAVNNWDSNAQRGDPSKGLLQTIGSTFRAYRDPRAPDDIFDGLANILASMRYTMARYGSLPAGYGRAGGYDDGGLLPPGYSSVFNGLRRPEMVLTDNQWHAVSSLAAMNSDAGGDFHGNLYLSSGEFLGAVEGVIERANTESGRVLARRIR